MKYRHSQYGDVTVHGWFDSFVMINTSQGVKSCFSNELTLIEENVIPLGCPTGNCPMPSLEEVPPDDTATEEVDDRVNLNTSPFTAIARALPAIGRLKAKQIVDRRAKQTEGRYFNFHHFKEVNSDLFEGDDVWDKLEPLVTFEV